MAHRDACTRGHRYVAGSYSWRASGTRRCLVCERMAREAKRARQQLRAEAVQPQPIGRTITFVYPQDKS